MVAFARTRRSSAELAAQYAVAASEGAVRAERWQAPLEAASQAAMRELRRWIEGNPPYRVLIGLVNDTLASYTLRTTRIVGLALEREGAWSSSVLGAIWEDLTPSPLLGGEFREGLGERWWLLEARGPSKTQQYREIIKSTGWEQRLDRWSKKITDKDQVADIIASGIARHANQDTIASRVAPFVQGYASSAMRIVRTETARVHNQLAEQAFEEFKDQISGFQILSQLDNRVRPAHAARHGRIYKKGRPRPSLPDAPNCRCFYAPILKADAKDFSQQDRETFSATTYDEWFSSQEVATQVKIVGKERWNLVKAKGIRKPKWQDFSNLRTGDLLSSETIKRFTVKKLRQRRRKRR